MEKRGDPRSLNITPHGKEHREVLMYGFSQSCILHEGKGGTEFKGKGARTYNLVEIGAVLITSEQTRAVQSDPGKDGKGRERVLERLFCIEWS